MIEARTPKPARPNERDDGDRLGRLLAAGLFVFGQVPAGPPARPNAQTAKRHNAEGDPA